MRLPWTRSARTAREERGRKAAAPGSPLRLRVMRVLFILLFIRVGFHVYDVQLRPDDRFQREDAKHVGKVEIPVPRGSIYDRNSMLLAVDRPIPKLYASPASITDPAGLANTLSPILGMTPQELEARFTQRNAKGKLLLSTPVKDRLSNAEVAALLPLDLVDDLQTASALLLGAKDTEETGKRADRYGKGLRVEIEQARFYPQGPLAAHVVGFVKKDGAGGDGLELKYDSYLRSQPGTRKARKDSNSTLLMSQTIEYTRPTGGDNLYLTIDSALQELLERRLAEAVTENQAVRAYGILMDPKTGAILAMACYPSYDPNAFNEADADLRKNRAAEFAFEPGSAFKIVTAASALEEKLITPQTVINCEMGKFNPYGHLIKDVHKMGAVPFTECFAESSNIGMIKVGAMLGPQRMESWIRAFGFGERTCSDLRVETPGIFRPRKQWSRLSMGSLPMGQEIAVSMFQLVRAYAVIANGGYLVRPYIVDRAESREWALTYVHEEEPPRRVLSEETAKTMQQLCHLVVTHGTGSKANIPEYRVGGKTGTAQIARPEGGFYPDRFTAVFCGFAPLADPQICAAIVVHEPRKSIYGGQVAAPVFKHVVRDALISMNVPEDPVQEPVKDGMPVVGDADTVMAKAQADDAPFIEELMPLDSLLFAPLDMAVAPGEPRLPDLVGMTKRQAREQLQNLGIEADLTGSGWVAAQFPPAGTPLSQITLCRLEFKNKSEMNHVAESTPPTRGM